MTFDKSNPLSRTYIINKLIADNNLKSYLEIGVSNPYSNFLKIQCNRKVSVDPCLQCEGYTKEQINTFQQFITHQMTSDEFFAQNHETFDIIFVDGDHSYEQSLCDLNNALRAVRVGGFVVMHDAKPIDFKATQPTKTFINYNGEVWKTVVSAIRTKCPDLQIGTFPYDFGVCVIRKLGTNIPEIKKMELDYNKDYSIAALNPVYNHDEFRNKKVSYFTSLYNTPQRSLELTTKSLLNQTNPNWEWVMLDDSSDTAAAARMQKYFAELGDNRIKYYRLNEQTHGFIGLAKKRAANLCTGDWLAELDHDDILMPDLTDKVIKNAEGFDFIYCNWASVAINPDGTLKDDPDYPKGFGMGYGSYRLTTTLNPINGGIHQYHECIAIPITPKSIRHIVGVPNHVRIWDKNFYNKIGGHTENLWVVDDYELIVRSFINGGRFLHLDFLGYLQITTGDNTTDKRRAQIQVLVASVLYRYDEEIKKEFELRNMQDWAYEYYHTHADLTKDYTYWITPMPQKHPVANARVLTPIPTISEQSEQDKSSKKK